MNKFFTLAAAGAMAATALSAQAQVTVDGQLTAAEVSSTGYTLVGRDAGPRGFSPGPTNDAGLLALYTAADANNIYFFLVATLQNDGSPAKISNALQLFISRPGVAGVPVGTALPKPAAATAPARNTSFQNFAAKLDQPGDMAVGIQGTDNAAEFQFEGIVYKGGATPTATAAVLSGATGVAATGATTSVTGQTGDLTVFNGAQAAYKTAASLNLNPGYGVAGAGAVPAYGLEIAISRASIGLPAAGGTIQVLALHNNKSGDFASNDFIPEAVSQATNLGANPDFTAIAGTQAASIAVGATGVTLATRREVANSLRFSVYPNPGSAVSVSYKVPQGKQNVALNVFDATGKKVRSMNEAQVGDQTYKLNGLKAGIYVVKLNVGGAETSSKVVIE